MEKFIENKKMMRMVRESFNREEEDIYQDERIIGYVAPFEEFMFDNYYYNADVNDDFIFDCYMKNLYWNWHCCRRCENYETVIKQANISL